MQVFVGTIQPFAFNFAPTGWQQCNGQIVGINQNQALFSLIGTTYGGNGTTTFQLPNLQSRLPLHYGNGPGLTPRVIGEMAGTESESILISNMPTHSHTLMGTTAAATTDKPATGVLLAAANDPATGNAFNVYGPTPQNAQLNSQSIGATGNSAPLQTMPPFLAVNFCIAMFGIFPSRN
jgi:microcystin-dependent protein